MKQFVLSYISQFGTKVAVIHFEAQCTASGYLIAKQFCAEYSVKFQVLREVSK